MRMSKLAGSSKRATNLEQLNLWRNISTPGYAISTIGNKKSELKCATLNTGNVKSMHEKTCNVEEELECDMSKTADFSPGHGINFKNMGKPSCATSVTDKKNTNSVQAKPEASSVHPKRVKNLKSDNVLREAASDTGKSSLTREQDRGDREAPG